MSPSSRTMRARASQACGCVRANLVLVIIAPCSRGGAPVKTRQSAWKKGSWLVVLARKEEGSGMHKRKKETHKTNLSLSTEEERHRRQRWRQIRRAQWSFLGHALGFASMVPLMNCWPCGPKLWKRMADVGLGKVCSVCCSCKRYTYFSWGARKRVLQPGPRKGVPCVATLRARTFEHRSLSISAETFTLPCEAGEARDEFCLVAPPLPPPTICPLPFTKISNSLFFASVVKCISPFHRRLAWWWVCL